MSRPGAAGAAHVTDPGSPIGPNPPASANYLAFGYTAVQDDQLVLYGWLYNTGAVRSSPARR